jgi:hypothetical protein
MSCNWRAMTGLCVRRAAWSILSLIAPRKYLHPELVHFVSNGGVAADAALQAEQAGRGEAALSAAR